MLKHVLIGVDGSPASRHAAHTALSLATQTHATATLVYVLEVPHVVPVGPLSGYLTTAKPRTEADVQHAREELSELAREYPEVHTDRRVELGHAAETLCELANTLAVDLLVVGARGLGGGAKLLLGSVSDKLVHQAPCPVMVVRERA
jgi:nucleotide-binding universal stress UspA family protein